MEAWFDEQVDTITNIEGNPVGTRRVYFHMRKASSVERAEPFVFDGPATERHMRDYPSQWSAFQAKINPELAIKAELDAVAPELGLVPAASVTPVIETPAPVALPEPSPVIELQTEVEK